MAVLETARTVLRPFRPDDLSGLHELCSQPGVGEAAGWRHHETLAESQRKLDGALGDPDMFAIEYREAGRVIGYIQVHADSEEGRADTKELGFVLHRDYQRRGFMTEAVPAVLEHLFSGGIERVYACCFQENEPSRRLIEGCGFTLEREGTYEAKSLGRVFPSYEYVYHRRDWHPGRA